MHQSIAKIVQIISDAFTHPERTCLQTDKPGCDGCRFFENGKCDYSARTLHYLQNYNIALSQWICIEDRVPTESDSDENMCVIAIHKTSNVRYYHWRSVANNPFDFTFWMPTPKAPTAKRQINVHIKGVKRQWK